MSRDLRELGEATRADEDAVARAKRRLDGALSPEDLKDLLKTVPGPRPGAEARVLATLDARLAEGMAGATPRRWWAALGAGLAGAAALLALSLWPADAPDPLHAELAGVQQADAPGLSIEAEGEGLLSGTTTAPRLRWREGRVALAVDPAAALDLQVQTREARVRVTGTVLSVERDVLGTHVALTRGRVVVDCLADGRTHTLQPGDALSCLPVSADGSLARARALQAGGAAPEALLAEVDQGLSRAEGSRTARDELAALRASLLHALGRDAEALAAARAWLDTDAAVRRDEVEQLALALSLSLEGCGGAMPLLEALAPRWLPAAQRLAACAPARAAEVLDAAEALARTPDERAALDDLRAQLKTRGSSP
ncbi:MAG: FecR domain-containing protein [Alphaproteobacteria bacterium]|nr:FecR domain-containing protein [Alphaproteobacteria bacterium]